MNLNLQNTVFCGTWITTGEASYCLRSNSEPMKNGFVCQKPWLWFYWCVKHFRTQYFVPNIYVKVLTSERFFSLTILPVIGSEFFLKVQHSKNIPALFQEYLNMNTQQLCKHYWIRFQVNFIVNSLCAWVSLWIFSYRQRPSTFLLYLYIYWNNACFVNFVIHYVFVPDVIKKLLATIRFVVCQLTS